MTNAYFRILVSQGGTKLFRTSRIPSAVLMIDLLSRVQAGFPAAEGYDVQVLGVSLVDQGEDGSMAKKGEILTSEQLSQMVQAMAVAKLAPMLSDVPVPPLSYDPEHGTN